MGNDIAIQIENLFKIYKLYNKPQDRFKETFHPFRKTYHHDFYALNDISFEIKKGDTVGIIGQNGAGKSTLLQIIHKVVAPTRGNVVVNGNVSALLEIGSGFNPELTGIQNVYFNGMIMGFSKETMDRKIDDILSFADIGEFIHQPVKTYSTGMFVRLAFSVATSIDPDILIVDEALSVGDIYFRLKCVNKMKKMIEENNVTLLFVSHDLMSVKNICKKTIFLKSGKLIDYGNSNRVVEEYYSTKIKEEQQTIKTDTSNTINSINTIERITDDKMAKAFEDNNSFLQKAAYQRIQNGKADIINVQLLNEKEEIVNTVEYDQRVILRMAIEINQDIHTLMHLYQIRNKDGVELIHGDSVLEDCSLYNVKKGEKYLIDWKFKSFLSHFHGEYTISTGLIIPISYDELQFEYCDRIILSAQFSMQPRKLFPVLGYARWENKVDVVKC